MAVFTHITEEQLIRHLAQFDIGALVSFTGIAEGVENTNYKLVTTQGAFILTLFEKRTRAEDLPFFITFMKYLHDKGISCPPVIAARNGAEIIPLNGKLSLITGFLEGGSVKSIEISHTASIGDLLAGLHRHGSSFDQHRDNTMSLPAWKMLISACEGKTDLTPLLQNELTYLAQHWPQNLPAGAVHADLFPDNIFFMGDKITGVIDFYFSCTEVFVYDLMLTLNAWCFEPSGLNMKKAAALLEAYQKKRPLTEAERKAMNFFGRAAALRIIATRLYDRLHPAPDAVVTAKDPSEYVRILEFYQTESFPL